MFYSLAIGEIAKLGCVTSLNELFYNIENDGDFLGVVDFMLYWWHFFPFLQVYALLIFASFVLFLIIESFFSNRNF